MGRPQSWFQNSHFRQFSWGRSLTKIQIAEKTAKKFETYPIVVRSNDNELKNDEKFENELATKPENYKKVFNTNFNAEMKRALTEIVEDLE